MRTSLPVTIALLLSAGCAGDLDLQLLEAADSAGARAIEAPPAASPALVDLGQALFFDKELSGNRDTACASCHHPRAATGDGLPLAFGTGGEGVAEDRVLGEGRELVPRNSPELFNRGDAAWTTMFWDMRVATVPYEEGEELDAPAVVPARVQTPLEAQALFPPTSAVEMRGVPGEIAADGRPNELAALDGPADVWEGLAARLFAIDGYRAMFADAFPGEEPEDVGYGGAAVAIAAFEADAFTLTESPYDRYLRGELDALSPRQKQGGLLFFGKAGCAECHGGALLTDQLAHNLAVPQLGPGKEPGSTLDRGRQLETEKEEDAFCFRTPPLRNVAATGPWMHDGAFDTLEGAVRHHLNARASLRDWDAASLDAPFAESATHDVATRTALLETLDPLLATPLELTDLEVDQLLAFLDALTDPAVHELDHVVPDAVPSGLPVDD